MLTRRNLVLICAAATSCARQSKAIAEVLPTQLQDDWKLQGTKTLPAEESPAIVRSLGLRQAITATYQGTGRIVIRVFEMNVEASAFELIQKWQQRDGLAIYKGPYFVVARGEGADQATVASFLQALQQEMKIS